MVSRNVDLYIQKNHRSDKMSDFRCSKPSRAYVILITLIFYSMRNVTTKTANKCHNVVDISILVDD